MAKSACQEGRDYIILYDHDRRLEVCDGPYIWYTTQSTSYYTCFLCCLTPLHSFRHPVEQDQKLGKSNCPCADHPLLEREEPEDQSLPPILVLEYIRTYPSSQRLRPP